MRYSLLYQLMFGSSLLLSTTSIAETISSSKLYWQGQSISEANNQVLTATTPWVFFSHKVETASMERGDTTLKLAVEDSEGNQRLMNLPVHLPTLPGAETLGQANLLSNGSVAQSNDESSTQILQVVSAGGSVDNGHVWATYAGYNDTSLNEVPVTNIILRLSDIYSNTEDANQIQHLTIPEFPGEIGGYANLVNSVDLTRSSSSGLTPLTVVESAGNVVDRGQTWAIMRGNVLLGTQERGDIKLALKANDLYSTTLEKDYLSSLYVTNERVSGQPTIDIVEAAINNTQLTLSDADINGPVYIATFSSPTSLSALNFASLNSQDWLGKSSSYGRSYFTFSDGDNDFIDDRFDPDLDNDGLNNTLEISIGTDVYNPNTDGDSLTDYQEYMAGLDPLDPNDLTLDPDSDGLTNEEEIALGTDINNSDSDGDGIPDKVEHDYDFDPINAADANFDFDKDGISNLEEFELGLNPTRRDTDGDGIDDNIEIALGLDATDANDALADSDNDGISNIEELALGTDPFNQDSDGDGVPDGEELARGSDPLDPESYAGSQYLLLAYADVNGDDHNDWLAYELDGLDLTLKIISSIDGIELSTTKVTLWEELTKVTLLSDRNNDGLPELGLFYFNTTSNVYQLNVVNPTNGNSYGKWNWPNTLNNVQFQEFDDLNSDSINEYAISGIHKLNGTIQLVMKDGDTRKTFNTYKWPNLWDNTRFIAMDDVTNDGMPEVALYGRHTRLDKGQLFLHNGNTAKKVDVYNWNRNWNNVQLFKMDDVDGEGRIDWGQFGQRKDDGRFQWVVKKGHSKKGVIRTFSWAGDLTNTSPILAPDLNNDGIREVAVAGIKGSRFLLRINDGQASNTRLKNLSWPLLQKAKISQLADLDGDNVNDFALYGLNGNNELQVIVKSTALGSEIGRLTVSGNWEGVSLSSNDRMISITAVNQESSLITVHIYEAENFELSTNYTVE